MFVLGITSPTGGLGVAESKLWILEQMAFRKLRRREGHPLRPCATLPGTPVVREESASEAPPRGLDHTIRAPLHSCPPGGWGGVDAGGCL